MRQCIFCENIADSREDVWPKWLLQKLGSSGMLEAAFDNNQPPPWKKSSSGFVLKYVCRACNNGWMSQLEGQAKPIIEALIFSKIILLDRKNQITLTTWAVKNAILHQAVQNELKWFYSRDERAAFRSEHLIPAHSLVWAAFLASSPGIYVLGERLFGKSTDLGLPANGFITTMCFGNLVLQVLTTRLVGPEPFLLPIIPDNKPGPWQELALQIWPVQKEQIAWPPPLGLRDESSFQLFCKRWLSSQ